MKLLNLDKTLKKLISKKKDKLSRKKKDKLSRKKKDKLSRKKKDKLSRQEKDKKIKKIIVKYCKTEDELKSKEGHFYTPKDFKQIISDNCDIYAIDENGKKFCLLKLRKGVIPNEVSKAAYGALEKQAKHFNDNRGAAAGLVRKSQLPYYVDKITNRDKYRVNYIDNKGIERKGHISNRVRSNIIGYYDMPDRNALKRDGHAPKCRQTAFTRDKVSKWTHAIPIFEEADKQFKKLMPNRHRIQLTRCKKTPDFQIANTAFSTITINYNYRSALHKDAGDLEEGFGNLMVLEKNKCIDLDKEGKNKDKKANYNGEIYPYTGGYLGFPKYGVAVDVRQGDYLAMNVHEWHANCPIICGCSKGEKCKKGVDHHGRLSLVCYLRKNMIDCAK
jgi:hypothetical protein